MRRILCLYMMLVCNALGALQTKWVTDTPVRAQVARGELNRIQIKDDRIVKAFGRAGTFDLESDPDSGQLFIHPAQESKPIALTLISEQGQTIDLLLMPRKVPAETIVLRLRQTDKGAAQAFEQAQPFEETIKKLVQAMAQGKTISGFEVHYFERPVKVWSDLKITEIAHFKGKRFLGQVFKVQNTAEQDKVLHEKDFFFSQDVVATSILRRHLSPKEHTTVFRVVRHD